MAALDDTTYGLKKNIIYELVKPKLIIPKEDGTPGLRRSKRTRLPPLRSHLGEKPIYRRADNGCKFFLPLQTIIMLQF